MIATLATIGLILIAALFLAWGAALVALPFLTVTGLLLRHNAEAARLVNLVVFGLAVGCSAFIASGALVSRFTELRLTDNQAIFAWLVLISSLALSLPCALLAARSAVLARRELERAAARLALG